MADHGNKDGTVFEDTKERRALVDKDSAPVVIALICSGTFWLLFGSIMAMVASLKMHMPDLMGNSEYLTFGRVRPLHLNTVIFGWASMTGAGVGLWILTRVLKTVIPFKRFIMFCIVLWNVMLCLGGYELMIGNSRGMEWLELPIYVIMTVGGIIGVLSLTSFVMLKNRNINHLYISVWYIMAAFMWIPMVGIVSSLPIFHGIVQAGMNWWFAHNVLGNWFTPVGLGTAYFFIPKVTGKPVYSYPLSMLGFWTVAIFYNWNGYHHLVGGPMPTWFITLSVAASIMMIIPVVTVAVNHHMTIVGSFKAVVDSPTLRFVVFGAMSYTFVSLQGIMEALRSVSEILHFSHFTIAHSHIGLHGFYTMIMFGACYYILPRVTEWEWHSPSLIKLHFWCAGLGIIIYAFALQIGGIFQGLAMMDPNIPFIDVVVLTKPYLIGRSLGGTLMTIGHFVFAWNVYRIVTRQGIKPVVAMMWKPSTEVAR